MCGGGGGGGGGGEVGWGVCVRARACMRVSECVCMSRGGGKGVIIYNAMSHCAISRGSLHQNWKL